MTNIKTTIASVAFGTMALCAGGSALAASITQPGELIDYALGAPLPEGVYLANTLSDGGTRGVDDHKADTLVGIPVIAWSTPWMFFGGRIEAYVATPFVSAGVPCTFSLGQCTSDVVGRDYIAMYNPAFLAGEAWDLGTVLSPAFKDWGFSTWVGGYAPVDNELRLFGHNIWVFNSRSALSYTGNHWDLTAHVVYGLTGDDVDTGKKVSPDYFNYDLTAVKTLGKWNVGVVGFGSADLSGITEPPGVIYHKQSQFAVGGLIGYDFTGISTALYVTRDVFSQNYFNLDGTKSYETRVWTRFVIPLWTPPAEAPMK